ncbi:hypothetical protein ACWGB8_02245 [Kitasatospora sp. NPDC054939]
MTSAPGVLLTSAQQTSTTVLLAGEAARRGHPRRRPGLREPAFVKPPADKSFPPAVYPDGSRLPRAHPPDGGRADHCAAGPADRLAPADRRFVRPR